MISMKSVTLWLYFSNLQSYLYYCMSISILKAKCKCSSWGFCFVLSLCCCCCCLSLTACCYNFLLRAEYVKHFQMFQHFKEERKSYQSGQILWWPNAFNFLELYFLGDSKSWNQFLATSTCRTRKRHSHIYYTVIITAPGGHQHLHSYLYLYGFIDLPDLHCNHVHMPDHKWSTHFLRL